MAAILSRPQCVKGDDIWCHAECGVDIVVCYSPEYPDNHRRGYPAGRVGQFILPCHLENSEATWLENWRLFNWTNRTSWDAILKWALVDVLYFNWLWVSSPHFPHEPGHGYITTVYPKKYAHGFCFAVLYCGYTLTDFPIPTRLTSLALWQSNDCPSASKATLMNMDKYFMWIHYERLYNHNTAKHNKTVCIFLGIYCSLVLIFKYHRSASSALLVSKCRYFLPKVSKM